MKVYKYTGSSYQEIDVVQQNAIGQNCLIEVRLDDGRTFQLDVNSNGNYLFRAWGNEPIKVGNRTQDVAGGILKSEPQDFCQSCYNSFEWCHCGI